MGMKVKHFPGGRTLGNRWRGWCGLVWRRFGVDKGAVQPPLTPDRSHPLHTKPVAAAFELHDPMAPG